MELKQGEVFVDRMFRKKTDNSCSDYTKERKVMRKHYSRVDDNIKDIVLSLMGEIGFLEKRYRVEEKVYEIMGKIHTLNGKQLQYILDRELTDLELIYYINGVKHGEATESTD
tara:strand:+ start:635 stop:973 length:339 start_codon:yes stop_codon:yes gene_type:complete